MTGAGAEVATDAPTAPGWRWWHAGREKSERHGKRADGWTAGVKWLPFRGRFMVTVAMPGSDEHWPVGAVTEVGAGMAMAAAVTEAAAVQLACGP